MVVLLVVIRVFKVVSAMHSWSWPHSTRGYREGCSSAGCVVSSGVRKTWTKEIAIRPAGLAGWLQDAYHMEGLLEAVEDVRIDRSILVRAVAIHVG